uniref:RRM domain-containing protein n=1 Tax=Strigamia maritima TaxID=126957 RepID=T1JLH4_STRMM
MRCLILSAIFTWYPPEGFGKWLRLDLVTYKDLLIEQGQTGKILICDMKMSKVGNQTNSNDPQAVNSRLFVGNLNTYQVTKDDVERMFKRYGRIAGISMHKGYAFVQFTNPYDARNAVQGEDSAVVCGQTL